MNFRRKSLVTVNEWEVRKPKLHGYYICPNQLQSGTRGTSLKLRGRGKVSWMTRVSSMVGLIQVHVHVLSVVYIHVCMWVAPPIVRGVWPMTIMLWQLFE